MPQNDDKDPKSGADDAKVDRILSGMKGARMPEILKVQSSESKGGYEPAVLVDQTQQEGISAAEVEKIRNERRDRGRRDATTAVIEVDRIPKRKNTIPLLVFLGMLALAAVALLIKANQTGADEDIAPATAAAVTQAAAPISPPSTALAPATTPTITSAAITPQATNQSTNQPNSAQINAQPTTAASPHASSQASSASSGSTDPDLLLFKPHRTP